MPKSKKTQDIIASQIAKENGKCSLPTIVLNMSEQNNNTINALSAPKQGILQCLPEMFTAIDFESHKHINGPYISGDLYKSYIFGKFIRYSSENSSIFLFFFWDFNFNCTSAPVPVYYIIILFVCISPTIIPLRTNLNVANFCHFSGQQRAFVT